MTIIETISSIGIKIRPFIIFNGKSLQTSWFNNQDIPDWTYSNSENGWASNSIALNWLLTCFLPETAPKKDMYRLLILDGHNSHISVDFMYECKIRKVLLLFLPAHSSHVLQPLDLGTFSSIY